MNIGIIGLLAAVTVPMIVFGLLSPHATPPEGDTGLTSHLAPVFVAGIFTAAPRLRALPWHWMALIACAPVLLVIHEKGSWWTGHHFFWIDLAITPGADPLIIAVATGRAAALTRLLDTRPLRETGPDLLPPLLIHPPILTILAKKVAPHHVEKGPHTYAFLVLAGAPLALLVAWLFANVFEFPFQRQRSWRSLPAAARPGHPTIVEPPVERDASPDDRPTRAPAQVG